MKPPALAALLLAVYALLAAGTTARPAAPPYLEPDGEYSARVEEPTPFKEPFKAIVVGNRMLVNTRSGFDVLTRAVPLGGPARTQPAPLYAPYPGLLQWPPKGISRTIGLANFPLRWHVTREACYFANASDAGGVLNIGSDEHLRRFGLGELIEGTGENMFSLPPPFPPREFTRSCPGNMARYLALFCTFDDHISYDYLPDGDAGARQFVLTNLRGELVPRGKGTGLVTGYWVKQTWVEKTKPEWSFVVHRCETRWDPKRKGWNPGPWSKEEELPVAFREHFHALAKGDDFFFLTASGKLYVASKPVKGKKRTVDPVYADAKRPILGMVVDAKEQRTFLFVVSAKGPAFFELSDKPEIVVYDFKAAMMPEGDEPLRSIMHKARVLAALGKMKGK